MYGLRQLRRRRASRTDLPVRPPNPNPHSSADGPDRSSHPAPAHGRSDNTSVPSPDPSSVSNRDYYRPPRHSRVSSTQHSYLNPPQDGEYTDNSKSSYDNGSSDWTRSDPPSPETYTNTLHPRWADYSFRESDLFYGTPRPPSTSVEGEESPIETPETPALRPSLRPLSSLNLWARVSGSGQQLSETERGFSVVRPPRPSQFPPSPSQ